MKKAFRFNVIENFVKNLVIDTLEKEGVLNQKEAALYRDEYKVLTLQKRNGLGIGESQVLEISQPILLVKMASTADWPEKKDK